MENELRIAPATAGGRAELVGAIVAVPFAVAGVLLWTAAIRSPDPISLQTVHFISGGFFAVGMAIGIYSSAWALVARETRHQLAACAAVLDAAACVALSVVIEWYFFTRPPLVRMTPFLIPAALWIFGAVLLISAVRTRKRAAGGAEEHKEADQT